MAYPETRLGESDEDIILEKIISESCHFGIDNQFFLHDRGKFDPSAV